jgi:hypothetical protein
MSAPKVVRVEAFKVKAVYFVDGILNNKKPLNEVEAGLVVRMLEAADQSFQLKGKVVQL